MRLFGVLKFRHAAWGEKRMYPESRRQLTEAAYLFKEFLNRNFGGEPARVAAGA
jgi:hypothetical protein